MRITRLLSDARSPFHSIGSIAIPRRLTRSLLTAFALAMLAIAPVPQRAQEICAPPSRDCFTRPPRDIAFIVDRSGSIALRGQTYNAAIDGVIRSIADETVIPRDGSVAITVVVFNDAATTVLPLTEISSAAAAESIISTLALLKCGVIGSQTFPCPFGATSFTAAIQAADIALARGRNENPKPGVERVFLMATDGNSDDPDGGAAAAEAARNAATILGIPVELDVILMGVAPDASDFAGRKANADLIVFPKPTDNLPGATFVINPGECNVDGAGAGGTDCNRQANEFAELARRI
ncbi:MAG TPA: vWA domain-containing protein, partial [Blastocatellia bacterium]